MADVNKIPKGWPKSNVTFKNVTLMDYQKKFLAEKGISMHGVEMTVDPASPEGDKTVESHIFYDPQHGDPDQMPGPTGSLGPVGPKGPPGAMGEPGMSPLQMAHEELALAQMKELGSAFKIPAHPDPEVQKKMVAEALEAQSGSITKDTLMTCKVLLPQSGLANANGDVYSPEALQQLQDQLQEKEEQFVTEHQNEPWKPEHELGEAGPSEDIQIPEPLAQYVGTPKSKPNHFEKLWKASTTKRSNSAEPNVSNTAKPTNPSEQILNALPTKWPAEAQKILDEEAKRKGQHVTLAELDTVHLLAPQEYDAQLVFEVVRQVIQEKIEDSSTHTLKKVSDTIAEVIVEERKAWKQAYNAVTSDYHRFKVEAENWSKKFAVEMAELSVQVNDLNNQLVAAKAEVKRLETENSKLRIKGTLGKSPRKVKVS